MLPASSASPTRVLITGANGHLGRRLIARLAPSASIVATVRSNAARRAVERAASTSVDVEQLDYGDAQALARAAEGCVAAVHLVGILKETSTSRYVEAHEHATRALVAAARAARLRRIVYVSILGSDPDSANAALASKGRAERILLGSDIPTVILRVPMVLGEDDYASRALGARARSRIAWLIRGASLEQPIYAGDVVAAMVAGLELPGDDDVVLDLAGPESLSRADLVRRAGLVVGARPLCVSLPLAPVLGIVGLVERLTGNPPVTRAMLEVLDHDDRIDPLPAAAKLGIRLTPLDEMLAACLSTNELSTND
jgi:uncharacterized protein YbjT (DUF2867 family)